jgi:hypothetical protein
MAGQFQNRSGAKLLTELRLIFKAKPVFQRKTLHVLFVCGGPVAGDSMRAEFIKWAKIALPDFKVLLAEDAFKEALFHDPPKFINLAVFEKLIAEISDVILIFPESAGSLAEVGYFSAIEGVRNKILVVNDRRYEAEDSFVTLGPVSAINAESFLQPALHVCSPGLGIDFSPLEKRLGRIKDRSKVRRKLIQHQYFRKLDYGQQLCVLFEIIRILRAVTKEGLSRAIKNAYGRPNELDLEILLSVLVAANWISMRDEFFVPDKSSLSLLEIEGTEIEQLSARALFYYREHDARAYSFAKG